MLVLEILVKVDMEGKSALIEKMEKNVIVLGLTQVIGIHVYVENVDILLQNTQNSKHCFKNKTEKPARRHGMIVVLSVFFYDEKLLYADFSKTFVFLQS